MTDIAFYTPQLSTGGVGKMRVRLANEMHRRGLDVDLLVSDPESPYRAELDVGVRVIRLRSTHPLTSLPALVRYLARTRPKVVVTDRLRLSRGLQRAQILAGRSTRLYTSVHVSMRGRRDRPGSRGYRRMQRDYLRHAGVIAVSNGLADELVDWLNLPRELVSVVYNPVVTPDIDRLADEPVDHPFFHAPAPPVLLSAGRMTEQKDFPTLLRAFALLRTRRPCRLVLLGEGKEKASLERLIDELDIAADVSLPGFTRNPYAFMRRSDVFVLSSRWEGFGNVLAESLAVGLPVVATDCPHGPREILLDGRLGPLVPPADPIALADAIGKILLAPPDPADLRDAGRRYTVQAACDGYLRATGLFGTPPDVQDRSSGRRPGSEG